MSNDKLTIGAARATTVDVGANQRAPVAQAAKVQPTPAPAQQPAAPDVKQIAHRIENYLKSVNRALEFKVDDASGRTVVTVRDAENGDLIRQIPNEEVLRFAQLAEEQTVVLVNEKI